MEELIRKLFLNGQAAWVDQPEIIHEVLSVRYKNDNQLVLNEIKEKYPN